VGDISKLTACACSVKPSTQPCEDAADTAGMNDAMTDLLWLLALRIAAGADLRLDLSTWPVDYVPHARA
jgi:hypothetical protein